MIKLCPKITENLANPVEIILNGFLDITPSILNQY
jgi:hypothetical protein